MPSNQTKSSGSKTPTNKMKNSQITGNKVKGRYSPYSNGPKSTPGHPKRDKSAGQSLKLREDLEQSIDILELHQLLSTQKPVESKKVESRAIKAEAEQLRKEQEAQKEFEGTIGSALEAMEKLGAS